MEYIQSYPSLHCCVLILADIVAFHVMGFLVSPDDGTDNSDHEREWEKQQLLKAGASTKVRGTRRDAWEHSFSVS